MDKWTHVVRMTFEIELLEGTRVGNSGAGIEIGGVDLQPLKDPHTGEPYLPGSSIKGKLRSALEKHHIGLAKSGDPCDCGNQSCKICPIFGAHKKTNPPCGAPRLVVRDAKLTGESAAERKRRLATGEALDEIKVENLVNRQSGAAKHPRIQERVAAGTRFDATLILKVFEGDPAEEWVKILKNALAIVQECESLGAGGSRGSGRIAIRNFDPKRIALADLTL